MVAKNGSLFHEYFALLCLLKRQRATRQFKLIEGDFKDEKMCIYVKKKTEHLQ